MSVFPREDAERLKLRRATFLLWPLLGAAAAHPSRHPVPEYAPVQAVLLSADLFEADYHAPELAQAIVRAGADVLVALGGDAPGGDSALALAAKLRAQGVPQSVLAHTRAVPLPHGNLWLRDYGPFPVRDRAAGLVFADFRYSDPGSRANDEFPTVEGRFLHVPVEPVDVELDGGNFLTNGDFCFTSASDLPIKRDQIPGAEALPRHGSRLGCRRTIVVRNPPHPHLDMWAKIVDDRTMLVNELDETALAVAAEKSGGRVPEDLRELARSLDDKARELSAVMKVVRLPMPLPYRGSFRTFANALLVNGHAIVPSYAKWGWGRDEYPDAAREAFYEARARQVYEAAGYQVDFVNADALVYNGGALRCVTSPVPLLHAAKGS